VKVDKNIPLPAEYPGGRPEMYPWRTMDIGDSFFVEGDVISPDRISRRIYQANRRTERKFTWRREEAGSRVWRIE